MARFPIVQRNCPYKTSLSAMMDGDVCRICSRQVHDLGAMSDTERTAFLASCSEEVCVSYALPRSHKVAALALSAAMMALPLAAQEPAPTANAEREKPEDVAEYEQVTIVIGGIKDFSKVEYVEAAEAVADDAEPPELPVTYESAAD